MEVPQGWFLVRAPSLLVARAAFSLSSQDGERERGQGQGNGELRESERARSGVLFFFRKSIGVTLVNKTVQVSSVQLNNTPSAYCMVHSPPKFKSLPTTM